MQNQSNHEITFDTHVKIALFPVLTNKGFEKIVGMRLRSIATLNHFNSVWVAEYQYTNSGTSPQNITRSEFCSTSHVELQIGSIVVL